MSGNNLPVQKFIDLFPSLINEQQQELQQLLSELEEIPNTFCAAVSLSSGSFYYLSKTIEEVLGYPRQKFAQQGVSFFFSKTPTAHMPYILARQAFYLKEFEQPDFDASTIRVMEIDAALYHQSGSEIPISQRAVFMNCDETGRPDLAIASYHATSHKPPEEINRTLENISTLLVNIKACYLKSLSKKEVEQSPNNNSLLENYYPPANSVHLTSREKQILQMLSNGHTTKAIAGTLGISFNTTESHRKHLLEKFQAKNSAELIKKASKVFWLE